MSAKLNLEKFDKTFSNLDEIWRSLAKHLIEKYSLDDYYPWRCSSKNINCVSFFVTNTPDSGAQLEVVLYSSTNGNFALSAFFITPQVRSIALPKVRIFVHNFAIMHPDTITKIESWIESAIKNQGISTVGRVI